MGKLIALVLALGAAVAAAGIALDTTTLLTFTDCAAAGSAAQTLTQGDWVMTVNDEATWLCLTPSASTCATLGGKFPSGTVMVVAVGAGGVSASCRSTNSTGDVQFIKKNN